MQFIRRCIWLLCRMVCEALDLPGEPQELAGRTVSEDRYQEVLHGLKGRFAGGDYYTAMLDSYEVAAAPAVCSVSADMADIWREVKEGLEAVKRGEMAAGIAHWRASFQESWGPSATQVLGPLLQLTQAGRS